MSKTVIAKYSVAGETFEIFVDADKAYDFITGKLSNPLTALEVEEVFKDANKGDRQSQDKLKKAFGTEDLSQIVGDDTEARERPANDRAEGASCWRRSASR